MSQITATPDRLIKQPAVLENTGLSRSSMYAMMKAGTFPQKVQIGDRAVAWSEREVNNWIDARIANRNA